MATCKDCFHYEACLAFSKIINAARDVETGCEHFKNRNDVVEVVRCKDRKWHEKLQHMDGYSCRRIGGLSEPSPDAFCSFGERKMVTLEDICSFRSWEECQNDAGDDLITSKKDFIVALCKVMKGPDGRDFTLSDSQISLLERCMRRLYEPYINSRDEQTGEYDQSRIPTMRHIYELVRAQSGFDAYDLAMTLKEVLPDLDIKEDENKQK